MPENKSFRTLTIANSQQRQKQEDGDVNARHHHDDNDDDEEEGKKEQGKRVCDEPFSETRRRFKPADEAEPRESNSETLRVPCSLESMVIRVLICRRALLGRWMAKLKEPIGPSDKEMITRDEVQAAQNQTENRLQGMDRKKSSGCKTTSAVSVVRTSASDGYNWRKYGQKQVKSPTGSRSYYRCSHSDCCAKKIECRDHLSHVIDIIYKSQHSHEPLGKTNSSGEIKCKSSNEPTVETSVPEQPTSVLYDSDSSPSKQPLQEVLSSAHKKRQKSPGLSENGKVIMKEEHVDEPELKRRVKKEDLTYLDSHMKPGLKSKFVVHAAEHVGISGDGYRWRKYGQKMVKGNPHPRNYYRCTSAGCPVRKQIETAADNPNAVIITYKGVHDHDMPVPKKRHGPPSASLMAAASPASSNNLHLKNTDAMQNQKSSPQSSEDTEGELMREALDLGGEKAIELARTLLSIGFEIKPS